MGLNDMVSAERVHIGFFGVRNAGKSSVVNAVTGQELAVVSDIRGTTTDPVKKSMELLPLGPVVIIDTPGIDDEGVLGELRVKRARQVLNYTDVAVLVVDAVQGMCEADRELITLFGEKKIPYVIAYNKADLVEGALDLSDDEGPVSDNRAAASKHNSAAPARRLLVSARTGENIYELKEMIGALAKQEENQKRLVADLLENGDVVVLVVPIDSAAPKGRLILPQQQVIRDALEAGATVTVTRESELTQTLAALKEPPRMVITDSQAFGQVSKDTPQDIALTSFSILMARYKGDLEAEVKGTAWLDKLKDGDRVLICEGCTHHRQCDDIGTVKMPAWVRGYTGKELEFEFTSGVGFPEDLSGYGLIIHCGACMLNEREMKHRIRQAQDAGVPITNYGVAIAQMHGILKRSLGPFPDILKLLF